jgi:hypothetical protein
MFFFQDTQCHYDNILEKIDLQAPHTRRHHSDAQFLIDVYNGAKS